VLPLFAADTGTRKFAGGILPAVMKLTYGGSRLLAVCETLCCAMSRNITMSRMVTWGPILHMFSHARTQVLLNASLEDPREARAKAFFAYAETGFNAAFFWRGLEKQTCPFLCFSHWILGLNSPSLLSKKINRV
jgi:hypothetical protein